MMAVMDRNDPAFREAMDHAARVAEWLLEAHNDDAHQEFALDVLNDYVGGILAHLGRARMGVSSAEQLAWAFLLTERRTDLKPHEERILELAWAKVLEDAAQDEWERLGL